MKNQIYLLALLILFDLQFLPVVISGFTMSSLVPNVPIEEDGLVDCTVPEVINGYINANGVLLATKAVVLPGTEIRLACWNGTVPLGSTRSHCYKGEWQPRFGNCIKHPGCGHLPIVVSGDIEPGESNAGSTRLIKCWEGYILTGASFIRCKNDMQWTHPGSCVPLPGMALLETTQCTVPLVENGNLFTSDGLVSPGSYLLANTEVQLECLPGFTPGTANTTSMCNSWDGTWVPPVAYCVLEKHCPEPPPINGGSVLDGNSSIGTVRSLRCHYPFYLSGHSYIKCLPNGTWSQPGICIQTTTWYAGVTSTLAPYIDGLQKAIESISKSNGNIDKILQVIEAGRGVNDVTHAPNTYPRFCPNAWTYGNTTPLRLAAACNRSADVIRMLLDIPPEMGGDINAKSQDGFTALMYAADNGNDDVVRLLIERGADVNAANNDGYTPLIYASWGGHNSTVCMLLEKGAKINAKSKRGYTALILAAHNGFIDVVCQLLDKGATLNARNSLGNSALTYAARFGYNDVARLLLSRGASRRGCEYPICKSPYGNDDSSTMD